MSKHRIKEIREKNGMTQIELSRLLGVSRSTVSMYEIYQCDPDLELLKKISNIFDVSVDYILNLESNVIPHQFDKSVTKINVYGKIPAGIPVELCENIVDSEEIPTDWLRGGKTYFGMIVDGDSMLPEFKNSDTLIFRAYNDCESGQFCAVTINGYDATFKKVVKRSDGITLQPLNANYEPLFFTAKQIIDLPVTILGVLKEVRRTYK